MANDRHDADRENNPNAASTTPSANARFTGINRRLFLRKASVGAAAAATVSIVGIPDMVRTASAAQADGGVGERAGGLAASNRKKTSFKARLDASTIAKNRALVEHPDNGEEREYPNKITSYSKALPHNDLGEVDIAAFTALTTALTSTKAEDFALIPIAGAAKLENPQGGLAFDLQGADSHHLTMPPAPRIDSAQNSADMVELYWMALARDVPFAAFGSDQTIGEAAEDLSRLSDYRAAKVGGRVTPEVIFRGDYAGDLVGPYVSQFLYRDVRFGAQTISHRIRTVVPSVNYMMDYPSWLAIQRGAAPAAPNQFDATPRYIRNMRDLGQYAHIDALYQPYLNAALQLLALRVPADASLPSRSSTNQTGFVEFGGPHVLSLVTEVALRALKACWYQKWSVHRRMRPEAFGGRIHNLLMKNAQYPINSEVLDSPALSQVFAGTGTYLLPQAYPEGSPTHPSYAAGHAAIAGACVTMLKAFFDESFVLPEVFVPNLDGTALEPLTGVTLTVGNELNKLASNISIGRNMGGIHYHSDYAESIKLGEEVAFCVLQEQKGCHNQSFTWNFTKFDGTAVTI